MLLMLLLLLLLMLVDAGKVLDIKVLDHVIVGETTLSLREEGLVDFV